MRRVIRGKMYNTDSAKKVGEDYNNVPTNDFTFWEEDLYRKRTGEFFLHCFGGPLSKHGEHSSDGSAGWGERIVPLSIERAKEWAENHLSGEEYEKIFEVAEEGNITISACLSPAAIEKLAQLAQTQARTKSAMIEHLIMNAPTEL